MYKLVVSFLILVVLNSSCNSSGEVKKREILSDDEFYEILKDLHKADGIISVTDIRNKNFKNDSVSLYNYVLKKHNVSREKFSKTVDYYSRHTEEYLVFYDSLSSYFDMLDKEAGEAIRKDVEDKKNKIISVKDSTNLWNLKDEWILPDDGETNPIAFKIETEKHGTYTLKANIKIYRDDKSINPRMTIIANYDDGTKDLNSVATMVKEGNFESYDVSIITDSKKELRTISGWVSDHSSDTDDKHMHIKNIQLRLIEEEKENIRFENRKIEK